MSQNETTSDVSNQRAFAAVLLFVIAMAFSFFNLSTESVPIFLLSAAPIAIFAGLAVMCVLFRHRRPAKIKPLHIALAMILFVAVTAAGIIISLTIN